MKDQMEMTCRLAVAAAVTFFACESFAATRRVVAREQDLTGVWASASLDLAATVASAQAGDEIIVGEGTYAFSQAIAITKANLTIRSSRLDADAPAPETTVFDAESKCRFFTCATAGTAPAFDGFTFRNGNAGSTNGGALLFSEVGAWKVSNCVFEDNKAVDYEKCCGGAIISAGCNGGFATNCVFRGNCSVNGGAVYVGQATDGANDKCTFAGCLFTNNTLCVMNWNDGGAAIRADQGARLISCRIVDNNVTYAAEQNILGGILRLGDNSTVVDTTICQKDYVKKHWYTESTTAYLGSGLVMSNSTIELPDVSEGGSSVCVAGTGSRFDACRFIARNRGEWKHPFLFKCTNAVFRSCLFDNRCRDYDSFIFSGMTSPSFENCTFYNANAARTAVPAATDGSRIVNCAVVGVIAASPGNVISNSCVLAAATPGEDCKVFENNLVGVDPGFRDVSADDFRLASASALRDRGVVLGWMTADTKDMVGNVRVMDRELKTLAENPAALPDIGACEYCPRRVRVVAREEDRTGVWASASLDLAATVASAQPGDEIIVGEGTYNVSGTIEIKAAGLGIRSSRLDADAPAPETTVLDGGSAVRILMAAAGTAPAIDGFTFRNGKVNGAGAFGGAVYFDQSGAWRLGNCVFEDSEASGDAHGGAVASVSCVGGFATNCVFRGNVANNGGAVYVGQATDGADDKCTFAGCLFTNNTLRVVSWEKGGAALSAPQGVRLAGCLIADNKVVYDDGVRIWGGVVNLGVNSVLSDTTIRQNDYFLKHDTTVATAVYVAGGCQASNCTIELTDVSQGGSSVCVTGTGNRFDACRFIARNRGEWKHPFLFKCMNAVFRSCLFDNRCWKYDSFIFSGMSSPSFENCTFYNANTARTAVPAATDGSRIVNCAVVGVIAASLGNVISNSCVLVAATPGEDCAVFENNLVGVDPKFVDAAAGDFGLKRFSPLRDRGVLLDWMTASTKDLVGGYRVMNSHGGTLATDPSALPDIGCCESQTKNVGLMLLVR